MQISLLYSLVRGHICKGQEVVPDRPQGGKDLREGRDDEVLAMAAKRKYAIRLSPKHVGDLGIIGK